jgi:hypothetical protein
LRYFFRAAWHLHCWFIYCAIIFVRIVMRRWRVWCVAGIGCVLAGAPVYAQTAMLTPMPRSFPLAALRAKAAAHPMPIHAAKTPAHFLPLPLKTSASMHALPLRTAAKTDGAAPLPWLTKPVAAKPKYAASHETPPMPARAPHAAVMTQQQAQQILDVFPASGID